MVFAEYDRFDALGLADLVARGEVSADELLVSAIARIDAANPAVNALVRPMFDLAAAQVAAGLPPGRLRGVPILLKDLISTVAGVPTGSGNRMLRDVAARVDGEFVRRLRAAGLVFVGKTNTPEFGLLPTTEPQCFGATRNPWDLARSAGGSSGGSAAAVAAGMVPLATGGDGGGSIRIPASCCALFGLKVTRGRTPTGPTFGELWHGFASEHVLTRSVRDSAALLDLVAGDEPGAPYAAPHAPGAFLDETGLDPGRLRIAFSARPIFGDERAPVHLDCVEAMLDTARLLESLGHEVVEAAPAVDGLACAISFMTILAAETRASIEAATVFARGAGAVPRAQDFELATWCLGLLGRATPASEYASASEQLQLSARAVAGFHARHDLLLTPTLAQPPALLGTLGLKPAEVAAMRVVSAMHAGWMLRASGVVRQLALDAFAYTPFTPLANVTGQPAMSVPLHWNTHGLPIGSHFIGRFGDEAMLFRLAAQLERARPWFDRTAPRPGARAQAAGG
ncbi:MAG: amidase [Burkholderiaceae bacterium]|nr:amidase [Burkholderiaceae bacterium]